MCCENCVYCDDPQYRAGKDNEEVFCDLWCKWQKDYHCCEDYKQREYEEEEE